jgi:glycerophosphoryl diester phosphodiesterase
MILFNKRGKEYRFRCILPRAVLYMLLVVCLFSCRKIKYYPDKDFPAVSTRILAHRASGNDPSFRAYSVEAAEHAFGIIDGIEVDLQLSKDRTVWLAHSADLPECGGKTYMCFPESTDEEVAELDSCSGGDHHFTRLEDIFALMSADYPGKYISLDVKAYVPCALASADVPGVLNVIGDEIIRLTDKYDLKGHIMVESETASFLTYVRKHSEGIECYLQAWGDFERGMLLCLQDGYSGISFEYKFGEEITVEHVQLLRRKGLKIQLWTVNSESDIEEALSLNPDYIQTDNTGYFRKKLAK